MSDITVKVNSRSIERNEDGSITVIMTLKGFEIISSRKKLLFSKDFKEVYIKGTTTKSEILHNFTTKMQDYIDKWESDESQLEKLSDAIEKMLH